MFRRTLRHTHWFPALLVIVATVASLLVTSSDGVRAGTLAPRATPVPILMYHELADPPADAPYPELYVRPADFRRQMAWLEGHGFQPVTLRAVWDHWHRMTPLPPRPVVISIDDGFRSTATVAFRALGRRGWPGVLNLALHHLDVRWGLWTRQVRELISAGWEIDSHTLTHPDLRGVDDARLEREVAGSRRALQSRFHVPVDFICYPSGQYDGRVIEAVRAAGYLGATTTLAGLARRDEPFALRRVRINRSDGLRGFASALQRALDSAG